MALEDFDFGHNKPDYKTDDHPTYAQACIGMMVCPHCGKAAICGDVESNIQTEGNDMIPRKQASQISDDGNNFGGRRGAKKINGYRFLSIDMLNSTQQLAEIIDAKVLPDSFRKGEDAVVCKLKLNGEFLLWTIRNNNPNLEILGDAFGDDERKWVGKRIMLATESDDFSGRAQIRVAPEGDKAASKRR